jgi:hypothetical protein
MTDKPLHDQMADDRAHYQANPPDDDEWEEVPAPPEATAKRPVGAMISVRLSGEEADEIRAAAEADALPVSAFIRKVVLDRIQASRANVSMSTYGPSLGNTSRVVSQVELLTGVPLSGGVQSRSAVGVCSVVPQSTTTDHSE